MVPRAEPRSYYGHPVLKAPVWTWEIPIYFFVGGMAGASAPLAAAARAAGNEPLSRRAAGLALAGAAVSPALLISDLGRPARFLNMLRVLKPTSAMSVGTWILSVFGTTTGLAAGWQLLGVPGRRVGVPAQAVSAFTGPLVSTYTAVLIAQTSVPVWHEARRTLPFVFAGSSLSAAGGALNAMTPTDAAGPARALAVAGSVLELTADAAMLRSLDPRVRSAYETRPSKPLHSAARTLTATGAATVAVGGRTRFGALTGGAALMAGSLLQRWAIIKAGLFSAADPEATVGPQRDRLGVDAARV